MGNSAPLSPLTPSLSPLGWSSPPSSCSIPLGPCLLASQAPSPLPSPAPCVSADPPCLSELSAARQQSPKLPPALGILGNQERIRPEPPGSASLFTTLTSMGCIAPGPTTRPLRQLWWNITRGSQHKDTAFPGCDGASWGNAAGNEAQSPAGVQEVTPEPSPALTPSLSPPAARSVAAARCFCGSQLSRDVLSIPFIVRP